MIPALLLALTLAQATAQASVRQQAQPSEGGIIRGRVTDRDTGQALPRFRVSVSRQVLRNEHAPTIATTLTDASGAYELPHVPPGSYLITALPPEHVATHLAQMYGYDQPLALVGSLLRSRTTIQTGSVIEANIALQRSFAIEGAVTTEEGDPIANAIVTAERIDRRGSSPPVVTDDLGRYRVFGLAPGSHRVCATPGAVKGVGAGTPSELLVRTCNPGDAASTGLEIKTADLNDAHVALRRSPRFSVSGEVFDSNGAALAGGEISFIESDSPRRALRVVRAAPGRFAIENVEPGRYTLQAAIRPEASATGMPPEVGSIDVVVDKADVERVVLRTARRASIFGVVTFDATPPESGTNLMKVRLSRDPASASAAGPTLDNQPVREDWTFEFGNVPEPVTIAVDSPPSGWIVRSVHYRGRDVTGQLVDLEASEDPRAVEIALTNRVGYIGGRIGSAPLNGRTVVVLAFDAAMLRASARTGTDALAPAATGLLDAKNSFKLGPLAGGEYLIVAVDRDDWFDASFANRASAVASVVARAERLQVLEGEQPTVTLAVVPVR